MTKFISHPRVLIAVFLLAIIITIGLSLSNLTTSLRFSSRVNTSVNDYLSGPAEKTIILSSMREAIGYGGATHHFKNFLLRHDSLQIMETQWHLMMLRIQIVAYRNIGVSAVEELALQEIENTFNNYADAVAVAEALAAEGASAEEIDAVVQIDDGPALDAFHLLDSLLDESRQRAREQTQSSAAALYKASLGIAVASIILAIILFGAFFVMLKLRLANAKLEDANAAKSDFLASMSHEIRTPMNGVLGIAELMLMSDLPDETRGHVEIIQQSGTILLTLLSDILDLSKIEAGMVELEAKELDVADALHAVASLTKVEIEEAGLKFRETVPEHLVAPSIVGDITRIRQILSNLINNAKKFTHEGSIEVALSQRVLDGGQIETKFEVKDTGIGLSEVQQAKIFGAFSQADQSTTRKYGGTGLGLSISRQLAELMGGQIGVTSSQNVGSTFWFTTVNERGVAGRLPEGELWRDRGVSIDLSAQPLPKLLVAEDLVSNQTIISRILSKLNFEFEIVENGQQAVEAVARGSFEIVLMDINMPVLDGVGATKQIRALCGEKAHIPIIALTANVMKGDQERYLAAGMNGYIPKPISPKQLLEVIQMHAAGGRNRRVA